MVKFYIYCLKDEFNNIRYIGKTYNIKKRYKQHLYHSKYKKYHSSRWINSMLIKGLKPTINILAEIENEEKANLLEIELIAHYKQFCKLTNITLGGNGTIGIKLTEERKIKVGNFHRGKTISEEHKKIISSLKKGKKLSEETKRKISFSNRGKKRSQEIKNKISKSSKGKKHSIETRQKMSKSRKGIKRSLEAIEKTAKWHRGKNRPKSFCNSIKGDNNSKRKNMKTILQYDLQNNFIKEWLSGVDASRELKIDAAGIYRCANNKFEQCGGFKWKFKI